MINFVEELPAEWQPQWELMQVTTGLLREPAGMFAILPVKKPLIFMNRLL
jgi:hypothetical protein